MCDRDDIVEANIRSVKLSSPDVRPSPSSSRPGRSLELLANLIPLSGSQYKGWDADKAVEDYWSRIRDQEKFYEPIIDPDVAWIKVVNVGERIVINRIEGELSASLSCLLVSSSLELFLVLQATSNRELSSSSWCVLFLRFSFSLGPLLT